MISGFWKAQFDKIGKYIGDGLLIQILVPLCYIPMAFSFFWSRPYIFAGRSNGFEIVCLLYFGVGLDGDIYLGRNLWTQYSK